MHSKDFVELEWEKLCDRLKRCASYYAVGNEQLLKNWNAQIDAFESKNAPETYGELLMSVADAANVAESWRANSPSRDESRASNAKDQALEAQSTEESQSTEDRRQIPEPTSITQEALDEASDESFPASDPPAWTRTHI